MPGVLRDTNRTGAYPQPPIDPTTGTPRIAAEMQKLVPELNSKLSLNINDVNTIWVEGHALCNGASATPPTDAIRGNFAVALYTDANNSTGNVSTFVRIPGKYKLWLLWAPDTIPASPTTKAVVWTVSVTTIARPVVAGLEVTTTNSIPAVSVGVKLPAAADQTVWTELYDNLRIDDFSTIGISLNRDGAVAGDDCGVDVYAVGLFFERIGG